MKAIWILIIMGLLLFACELPPANDGSDYSPLSGVSVDRTSHYTLVVASAADQTITDVISGRLKVISTHFNDSTTLRCNLTMSAYNATAFESEVLTGFNNTAVYSSDITLARIDKLVLSKASIGTVTVSDNATGNIIATFLPGELEAYNGATYDGTEYVAGGLGQRNSSVIDVSRYTEYALWTDCDTNVSATGVSFAYWVSPDNNKWFSGEDSIADCTSAKATTTLTDEGVRYLKFGVTNGETTANKVYTKFTYK